MSTRFYAGQQDYIIQLNLMDDEFDAAVASVTGKADANNSVLTGVTTTAYLFLNRVAGAAKGISWYDTGSNTWTEYMASGGQTSQGPKGVLTAPTGTLVSSTALRSVIDNTVLTNGWTWEVNGPAGTAPSIVAELDATGNAKFYGNVSAAAFLGNATSSTNATNTGITNDNTTNATMYVTFVGATSGNQPHKVANTKLTFNPSTGALSAPTFVGSFSGTVTNAENVGITDDNAASAAVFPMWVTGNSGNLPAKVASNVFSIIPSLGQMTLARNAATNTVIELKTTSGSVFMGQGAALTYAIGATTDLVTNPWFKINSTTGTFAGDLVVNGNLTINGTTTTVHSTTVTLDDPVLTLGGSTPPTTDDNKDRGIEYRWHNGTAAKLGFFGYDDSMGRFTFIPDATNTGEVYSGAVGTIAADLAGNVTGNADTATKLATARTITVTGDGSGSFLFDGTGDVSLNLTVLDDSHNHTISTVTGLQSALDNKFDKAGGVIGNQTTGWAAVNAPTARVVDTNSSGTSGGLAIESNNPVLQFIDRSAGEASGRLRLNNGVFVLGVDNGSQSGTYTEGWTYDGKTQTGSVGGSQSVNVAWGVRTVFGAGTTGTTQYGIYNNVTFNESATVAGIGNNVVPTVKATTFTMADLIGFNADVPVIGAGATVTSYTGVNVSATTAGATFGAAFRGRLASGTGRWNLYMSGTAANFLAGNLLIGSTSDTGETLQVTGTAKFTGTVTITTAAVGDSSTAAASTAFVQQAAADAAIVYSIVFG